jgi:hypothetical protein
MKRPLTVASNIAREYERVDRSLDVARVARALLLWQCAMGSLRAAGPRPLQPADVSKMLGDPDRVAEHFKANAGGSQSSATEVGTWRSAVREFLNSLADVGAAEGIVASATPAPWISDQILLGAISVANVLESQAIPARIITASAPAEMSEYKIAAIVSGSETYFTELGNAGLAGLNAELRKGCIAGTDQAVMNQLLGSIGATASSGDPATDVQLLLNAVGREAGDRLVWVAGVDAMDQVDALPATATPMALQRWPVYCTSAAAVPADSLVLVNATSCRYADRGLEVDTARSASLQLLDNPTNASDSPPVPTNLVSLFQTNSVAVRVLRQFKFGAMRANPAAEVSGVSWNGSP